MLTPSVDRRFKRRLFAIVILAFASNAKAFEEAVRRTEVDGGIHVPVVTKAPSLLSSVKAVYPSEALDAGVQGSVGLQVLIEVDGGVGEIAIVKGAGYGFDAAAAAAVKQFTFSPGEVDGVPYPLRVGYTYHFTLQAPPPVVQDEPSPATADARVSGRITVRGSRKRVEGALVRCDEDMSRESLTDSSGAYTLEVPHGSCRLRASSPDVESASVSLDLQAGVSLTHDFTLVARANAFHTVVRKERDQPEVVDRVFGREEAQKVPGTFADPLRVIQNLPGVARPPAIFGLLVIRGAEPNQSQVFFDGVPIPILYHLLAGPSVVNAEFIEQVDFYPGGFGPSYGRAIGGVVDVAARVAQSDTWHGTAKLDPQDAAIYASAPIGKSVTLSAGVRRSVIDAILATGAIPTGSTTVVPAYWDYQLRADFGGRQGGLGSRWSLFAFGADDAAKISAAASNASAELRDAFNLAYHTTFHRFLATWLYRTETSTFKVTPYLGYDALNAKFGTVSAVGHRLSIGLRAGYTQAINSHFTFRSGLDLLDQPIIADVNLPPRKPPSYAPFPGDRPEIVTENLSETFNSFDSGLYADFDFPVGPVVPTLGFRGNVAVINGHTIASVDPRVSVRYNMFARTTIKASAGLYSQAPMSTWMLDPPWGNPDLVYQRAFQTSVGIVQRITRYLSIDVTGYYNRRFDNVVLASLANIPAGGAYTPYANTGLGRSYGMEVLLRHDVSKYFFGWIAYTLSRSESRVAGTTEGYVLNDYDQTHNLTVVGSVKLPRNWEIGVRFRYVTGNPTSPLIYNGDLYAADRDTYVATYGPRRSARVPDFHQLDLRVEKTWPFGKWSLAVYLDIQNVYFRENVEFATIDLRARAPVYATGIPILPFLGVRATL